MNFCAPSPKVKYLRGDALAVAAQICRALKPWCERIIVAGSLRRRKAQVGDVEILYIPKFFTPAKSADDLFNPPRPVNLADAQITDLCSARIIEPRENIRGSHTWGDKNKLARHIKTGIPVDLFATTEPCWYNYLVCRTGGAENNVRIATTAQDKHWKWNPYGPGFTDSAGHIVPVKSEQDVFSLLKLPYLEPWERS